MLDIQINISSDFYTCSKTPLENIQVSSFAANAAITVSHASLPRMIKLVEVFHNVKIPLAVELIYTIGSKQEAYFQRIVCGR